MPRGLYDGRRPGNDGKGRSPARDLRAAGIGNDDAIGRGIVIGVDGLRYRESGAGGARDRSSSLLPLIGQRGLSGCHNRKAGRLTSLPLTFAGCATIRSLPSEVPDGALLPPFPYPKQLPFMARKKMSPRMI